MVGEVYLLDTARVVTYVEGADGPELHLAFNFPLMPRIYMAIAQEDRFPITDILRQTPDIPNSCQWALFLRNHDELTLEMVTDDEREPTIPQAWNCGGDSSNEVFAHAERHDAPEPIDIRHDRIKAGEPELLTKPQRTA